MLQDLKEACCIVPQLPTEDGATSDVDHEAEPVQYELPDGTKVQVEDSLSHITGR